MAGPGENLRALLSRLARKAEDAASEIILDGFRDQLAQVRALIAAGDPAAAVEVLEVMLRDRPDHVGALTLLGVAELALGHDDRAADAFGHALRERPGDAHALVGLGQAEVARGRLADGVALLGKGVDAAGGDRALLAVAYLALGRAWRGLGELDKAIRELRKAVAEAPDDADARAALGQALLDDTRTSSAEARRHLERAAEADAPPAAALLALAQLELVDGRAHEAGALYERARVQALAGHGPAARAQLADALIGLGDVAAGGRDHQGAHHRYLEALEIEPRRATTHARLAALHGELGNPHAAIASYERALALGSDPVLLARAITAAHTAGERDRAVRWANDLLALDPTSAIALAARAADLIDRGELVAAAGLIAATPPSVELAIEEARLERARDPGPEAAGRAAAAARRALDLAPDHAGARAVLADARAAQLAVPADDDIAQLAGALERVLTTRSDLAGLVGEVARATALLDQPLLVTVMGEFSSGKSSFVNAFIGADVAATGITPTTATINVVKYGHERGGRLIARDGGHDDVPWGELHDRLRALTPAAARAIDRVEIFLPLDHLAKVHIVDTPGLNSILPEHEDTARGFIARADAVVWVFTAGQGGKASERKALDAIRAQGKRVLGVLNKRDQLSDADVAEVVAHVREQLGDRVEVVVPFSARRALAWKDGGGVAPDDGNWAALADALEVRFFAQARQIKRAACARRLTAVIETARGGVARDRERMAAEVAARADRAGELTGAAARFADEVVAPVRRSLAEGVDQLYQRAALEVIDLVRPRQLPFGSHSATPADRDYLVALLDDGYEALLRAAEAEVAAAVAPHLVDAPDRRAATIAEVVAPLARARAYVSGYLAGGTVDAFFRNDLPKLSLEPEVVRHALFRAAPDLERLVAEPLARAGTAALGRAAAALGLDARRADVACFDLEVGLGRALDELAARLAS
ncbi:MAG TPA: dynamin family protein [Kofleriaceae bacterium]|nr:dynamin family protein [Kofleriaceae bacterium]